MEFDPNEIEINLQRLFGEGVQYELPDSAQYLNSTFAKREECERKTKKAVAEWEDASTNSLRYVGVLLRLLSNMAVCEPNCGHEFHVVERLAGRIVTQSTAALLLMTGGYYDEALTHVRSVGEIANLLVLFLYEREAFEEWLVLDSNARKRQYSPVKVRTRLEGRGVHVPITHPRYSALSETATHVTPHLRIQAYNPLSFQTLGGYFQPDGVRLVLTELSIAVADAATCAMRLAVLVGNMQEEDTLDTFRAAILLQDELDYETSILTISTRWKAMRDTPAGINLREKLRKSQLIDE